MAEIMKQGKCGDNLTWTLDDEGLLTISGEGEMWNYYIFFDSPFCKNTNITKVKIIHGVTSIGNEAFYDCKALTSIEIPDSVTWIGDGAFFGCEALQYNEYDNGLYLGNKENPYGFFIKTKSKNITACSIKDTCKIIEYRAFWGCKALTSIEIGGSVNLDYSRNGFCERVGLTTCEKLTTIEIAEGVTSIGESAFEGCKALTKIEIGGSVNLDYSRNGFCERVGLTTCEKLTTIEIAEGVTSIGESAFEGCKALTSIEIPNSVTNIGEYAFYGCKALQYNEYDNGLYLGNKENPYAVLIRTKSTDITACKIKDTCKIIRNSAFEGCKALTSIEIPNSVTSIGYKAFWGCEALTSIEIPNSVTNIENRAFSGCEALTSIEIPNSVTNIGDRAFYGCEALTNIEIPNSVTSIGDEAFYGCEALKSIEVVEDNANYASIDGVLYDKGKKTLIQCPGGKTSIEIPDSVTSIGEGAFKGCKALTSIEIPNSVTSIGDDAFEGCKALTNIEIPNSVTSIGDEAFYGCEALTSIEVVEDNANYASIDGVLYDKEKKTLIQCPEGKTNIEIPNSVTSIGDEAFLGCKALTSIEIPNSVTIIGNHAFSGCEALTSIEIPNSVTSIGDSAFSGCEALKKIKIPNSVTSIGVWAFSRCEALKKIKIPNSVTSIGYRAFERCSALTSIHIRCEHPEELKIDENFFYNNIENCTLYVPKWTEYAYRQHPAFRKFKKIKVKHDNFIDFIKYLKEKYF